MGRRQDHRVRAKLHALTARWIPSTAAIASLVVFSASGAQPPAPAYEDQLIEGGALVPEIAEELAIYNPEGLPRSWRIEGFASRIESGPARRYENGMLLSASLETRGYGVFSVDATLRAGSGGNVFTLWQRGMPFDNAWKANNALGMVNTPGIDLSRRQYRFFMPTFPLAGFTTEWIRDGDLQLQAAVGEPGTFNGVRLAGFSRLGGTLATAGAQWNPSPRWQIGVQAVDTRDVQGGFDARGAGGSTSARALYGGASFSERDNRVQLNFIESETNHRSPDFGFWLDGELTRGRFRHNYGVFRFGDDLAWGYAPISGDLQGGYYRIGYASQQWTWSGGADVVSSVTGRGDDGVYATATARYQVSRSLGIGGGANIRRAGVDAYGGYLFFDKLSALGTTRVQVDAAAAPGGQHSGQLSIDQGWPTQVGLRLSTTLSVGEEKTIERHTRRLGLAASGSYDITNTLTVDGSVRWTLERDTSRHIGRFANVGLVWRISPRWSLLGTYYDNRVEVAEAFTGIAPLIPVANLPLVPRDRAIFVTLRYEDRAGTPIAPLGGMPGMGAGTLVGYIFYDANDDGRKNANEAAAPNVTVVLDGRYGVRTNTEGRFEFPLVASGPHSISVIPDNLALPYAVQDDGRREVVVRTRETTTVEIAAQRLK